MTSLPWWAYSIAGAFVWGLHFNMVSKLTEILPHNYTTALTIYVIPNFVLFGFVLLNLNEIGENFAKILSSDIKHVVYMIIISFSSIIASLLLYTAIQKTPNVTAAAIVDITYPLFGAILAWVLFGENHISPSIVFGGLLIFAGAAIVIYNT